MRTDGGAAARLFDAFGRNSSGIAITDWRNAQSISYRHLWELVDNGAEGLRSTEKRLACLKWGNDIGSVLSYLSLLKAGYAVWISGDASEVEDIVSSYSPDLVVSNEMHWRTTLEGRYSTAPKRLHGYLVQTGNSDVRPVWESLAILLRTSGSFGVPKAARLSYENIKTGAYQASAAIGLSAGDSVASTTPLHHIYGLSLLHSALAVGANISLPNRTVLDRPFWDCISRERVTLLTCVPATLQFIQSADLDITNYGVRKITSSGASLPQETQRWLTKLSRQGVRIYSMYGATEACGRMCVLPADEFEQAPSSVGRPVQCGHVEILPSGEIMYRGDNVALGYAMNRGDLARGDDNHSLLYTGDIGYLDNGGNLRLTGRIARICKVLGQRVCLDDIEAALSEFSPIAVVGNDWSITIYHASAQELDTAKVVSTFANKLRLPTKLFKTVRVSSLPRTASGKIAYASLPVVNP